MIYIIARLFSPTRALITLKYKRSVARRPAVTACVRAIVSSRKNALHLRHSPSVVPAGQYGPNKYPSRAKMEYRYPEITLCRGTQGRHHLYV